MNALPSPGFRCSFRPDMPPSLTSGSSIIVSVQHTDIDIGLRHGPKGSAIPQSVSRGAQFSPRTLPHVADELFKMMTVAPAGAPQCGPVLPDHPQAWPPAPRRDAHARLAAPAPQAAMLPHHRAPVMNSRRRHVGPPPPRFGLLPIPQLGGAARYTPFGGRGAVFLPGTVSTNSDCACAHNRHCDSTRDYNQLLGGRHDHPRSADDRHHLVLLTASTERELAHAAQRQTGPIPAATPLHDGLAPWHVRNEGSPSQWSAAPSRCHRLAGFIDRRACRARSRPRL